MLSDCPARRLDYRLNGSDAFASECKTASQHDVLIMLRGLVKTMAAPAISGAAILKLWAFAL